jgi:ABC-type polysaccharide/polyol phosphate export permease
MRDPVTVYSAAEDERISFASALSGLARQIARRRYHINQLFIREFASAYQLTRFGVVWNYILPIVPISVWVLLSALRMFPSFEGVSSVVNVTMGVTLWYLFAGFLMTPITTVESRIREGAKSEMPLIGYVIAGFAQLLFDTLVRVAATAAVFAYFHGAPSIGGLAAPFVVAAGFIFFSGIGLILAVFNLAYRDIVKIVGVLLQYGMLLSGIVFPIDEIPVLSDLVAFNPFYVFVDSIRTLMTSGDMRHPIALAAFSFAGALLFIFACRFFHASERRLKGFA